MTRAGANGFGASKRGESVTRIIEDAPLRLGYERRGRGEPLLLIHGAGSNKRVWDPVLDRLALERGAIAVDLPGHGDSPLMEEVTPPTPANFAYLMAAFLRELGIESAHIVGNSSGGWTALEMAKLGHARSVTALSPAGLWRGGTPRQIIWAFRLSHFLARRLGRAAPLLFATGPGRTLLLGQFFGRPWKLPADSAIGAVRNFACSPGLWPHIRATSTERFSGGRSLEVPVTVAWGSREVLLLPGQARLRKELPSQTRWIELPGSGHVPTYDAPALVAGVILEGSDGTAGGRG
jgi:pimeloyl-ACP methyl ester carboxylesterase